MSDERERRPSTPPEREGETPSSGGSDEGGIEAAKAANRFDIRRLIGGLFLVYAVILIALGLFGSHQIKHKAAGIDIDLWAGLGMLLFAAFMIAWALLRPTVPEPETGGEGQIRRASAT
jgi:hypothetical protein